MAGFEVTLHGRIWVTPEEFFTDARVQAVIGLDFDGHTVEATTVGFVRHLYLRDILSMKLCPVYSLNGLYRPKPFADKAAHLPAPDRVLDFDQRKVVSTVYVPLRQDHSVPDIGIECDSHRQTFSHPFHFN
jgi:hypothetical protein